MGKYKYRKRENDIDQNDIAQNGEGLFDLAKDFGKKSCGSGLEKRCSKAFIKSWKKTCR